MAGVSRQVFPFEPRITQRFYNLPRIIVTTVANDQYFEIRKRLFLRAKKRITEHTAPVVGGDNDTYQGNIVACNRAGARIRDLSD